jgi:5'-methylthioadenosine phosphorylase
MKAIIGGTGIDEVVESGKIKSIETKYGNVVYYEDGDLIFLLRHGNEHEVPPHLINYRANVEALSLLNVDEVISIYCVGSIKKEYGVGCCTLIDDFIDFTTRGNKSFSIKGNVFHERMFNIFDSELQKKIIKNSKSEGIDMMDGGIYVCTEGPRFETKSEIKMYGILGGDFVGMTAIPEIPLIKEKKIKIASIAYSINWATGLENKNGMIFVGNEEIKQLSKKIIKISIKALKDK